MNISRKFYVLNIVIAAVIGVTVGHLDSRAIEPSETAVAATARPAPYFLTVQACEDVVSAAACIYFDENVYTFFPNGPDESGHPVNADRVESIGNGYLRVDLEGL